MIVIDIPQFRVLFPAFADVLVYPDILIQLWFDTATSYVSDNPSFNGEKNQTLMLYLMTAHLLVIITAANQGNPVQAILSAAEGTVNVGYVPPPVKNGWQWWLSSTAYGQQLWALLQTLSVGGFYAGGRRVRDGIRQTKGEFLAR